jgi:thiol:disulfide interchange protein
MMENRNMQAGTAMKFSLAVVTISLSLVLSSLWQPGLVTQAWAQSGQSSTQTLADSPSHSIARLITNVATIKPGQPFMAGAELTMQPGWHTYYKDAGDAGMPTKIIWELPPGFTAGELLWEKPNKFNDAGIVTYGYHDRNLVAVKITPPDGITGDIVIKAKVKWLSCKDQCIPGKADLSLTLKVSEAEPAKSEDAATFENVGWQGKVSDLAEAAETKKSSDVVGAVAGTTQEPPSGGTSSATNAGTSSAGSSGASSGGGSSFLSQKFQVQGEKQLGLAVYLLFAFIGGFILNFMPCVLPVIALKVCSMCDHAHEGQSKIRIMGLSFAAGMISSFMVLAFIVLAVQATGRSVGWGFLFQYPAFLIGMSVVILLFALSLFGMFYISLPGTQQRVDELARKEGPLGTFFKGVLATILSTPCTAPFLGTAVGFALTQNAWTVLAIFFTIGIGMALPYFALMINPGLIKFIPKPGYWMEKFKEAMGFVLLATVVWLLYVLGTVIGAEGVVRTVAFLVSIGFATWVVSSFTDLSSSPMQKSRAWGVSMLAVGLTFYFCYAALPGFGMLPEQMARMPDKVATLPNEINWLPFNVSELEKALGKDKTVMLDFTAEWCLTCKVNERTVLDSAPVVEKLKALNVVTMKADWTTQDPQITALLSKFSRPGVPLYVIFPAGKPTQPIVLPEVITPDLVREKLAEAGPSKS